MSAIAIVQEKPEDLQKLLNNGLRLQIVQTVRGPGMPLVWSTSWPAPVVDHVWTIDAFALNYCQNLPQEGTPVQVAGTWQPCNTGHSYSLQADGSWQLTGDASGDMISLSTSSKQPVFPVLGVQLEGWWSSIFVCAGPLTSTEPTVLVPMRQIQLFYDPNPQSGVIAPPVPPDPETFNYVALSKVQQYFTFHTDTGIWDSQTTPFDSSDASVQLKPGLGAGGG